MSQRAYSESHGFDYLHERFAGYRPRWEFVWFLDDQSGKAGRLLEIGCGGGTFLEMAAGCGYQAVGVAVNFKAVKSARQKDLGAYGTDRHKFLTAHSGSPFDVVVCFHLLEHLGDLVEFVRMVRRASRSGGYLALSVPNPKWLGVRFRREPWGFPPHHLTRWNPRSFGVLMRSGRFEVISR